MFLPGMRTQFTHLTSPACIGNMQLKNRMVMSPMTTAYCNDDQTPSERLIRYFEERARGGVGLITMELITVDETHRYMHRSMTLGHDKYIEGHRRITDRIHQYGCKVQPQLSHTGPESVAPMFGGPQPVGPSVSVAPVWGWASRELDVSELPEIARQYGEAARRAREAGYDGIELHGAHCYNLLGSFLSPQRNKRTDEYSAFSVNLSVARHSTPPNSAASSPWKNVPNATLPPSPKSFLRSQKPLEIEQNGFSKPPTPEKRPQPMPPVSVKSSRNVFVATRYSPE